MRVIIIEPLLKNQQGHIFFYLQAMTAELKKRDVPYFVFGNLSADGDALRFGNFSPCFSEISVALLKRGIFPEGLLILPGRIRQFRDQLLSALIYTPGFSLQEGDIIFSLSPHIFEFAVLGWFLYAKGKALAEKGCRVIIGFNFPYTRNSPLLTFFLSRAYRLICKYWIDRSSAQVAYFSSAELTKNEFERLLHKKVSFFPTPVYPLPVGHQASGAEDGAALYRDKIKVSYLGGARYNKGFDIFIRTVQDLNEEKAAAERFFFLVQADIHEQQSKKDIRVVRKYVRLLEVLARKVANIRIIYGTLSSVEYYKLLFQSDIVVLPYRDRVYQNCSSNIFLEAVIAGRIPVVPADTGMAADLLRYHLDDLIFKNADGRDLSLVIKRVSANFKIYHGEIRKIQEDFIRFHSAANLADALLGSA